MAQYVICGKEKPFPADLKFLKHKGVAINDEADNGIQLLMDINRHFRMCIL